MQERLSPLGQRMLRHNPPRYDNIKYRIEQGGENLTENVTVHCGWGRLIMGQTFSSAQGIAESLLDEGEGQRDIAVYVNDPHIVLSYAPQSLFLDPSDTYRLWLNTYRAANMVQRGFLVRRMQTAADADAINALYIKRGMVPSDTSFIHQERHNKTHIFLVAEDCESGEIIGTVMGVNHHEAFGDPEKGASMWCLAVDPQARYPAVGEALVRRIAEHFQVRGLNYMDLTVLHGNVQAKALYQKLGFTRIQSFVLKKKNGVNEALYLGPRPEQHLNPYARIIIDEAHARGIQANILDAEEGYFELSSGSRTIVCRESLSELTSAIAMSRCQNKIVTHKLLAHAGLCTPSFQLAKTPADDEAFLRTHGTIVVKPDNGEQGQGVTVGVTDTDELADAIVRAKHFGERILLESYHPGLDLRIVVIGFEVVAAAIRKPAEVVGDGQHTIRELIEKQSRRREAATGGESRIRIDEETLTCLHQANFTLDSVLMPGHVLRVKKAANLHKGGTIHDCTEQLHPALRRAAVTAARAISIPMVGLDFIVPSPLEEEYVIIEANERAGLANHEPQPTAQKFIDLLFPETAHHSTSSLKNL